MTPVNARPGDMMILKPPAGGTSGHTMIVRDRHEIADSDKAGLAGLADFAGPTDKVHVVEVDSSWGAGHGNVLKGGAQRRQFLYNEDTKQWADVTGGIVEPSPHGPYEGHPIDGFYRPK
jgi:hypothetical protein